MPELIFGGSGQCPSCKKDLDFVSNFCQFCGTKIPPSLTFQKEMALAEWEEDLRPRLEAEMGTGSPIEFSEPKMTCTDALHLRMAKMADAMQKEKEEYPDLAHLVSEPSKFCHNCGKNLPRGE